MLLQIWCFSDLAYLTGKKKEGWSKARKFLYCTDIAWVMKSS